MASNASSKTPLRQAALAVEIIAVGTELLMGETVNTNATWLSQSLAEEGFNVYHHTTVGDNPARIQAVMAQAFERSNVLVFTGGLGPTEDDLTVATITSYFNEPLVADPNSEAVIKAFFIAKGQTHSPSNLKQALRPAVAQAIANPIGTAPGLSWTVEVEGQPKHIIALPGVPREMKAMWPASLEALHTFAEKQGVKAQVLAKRSLHFFGIGESKIGEGLKDLMDVSNPSVAPYVGDSEVRLRIAAQAPTLQEAEALITPVQAEIISRLKEYYFGEGDTLRVEQVIADALIKKQQTLSVAESCTGGYISHLLTNVAGSSAYTTLNVVTYSNAQKTALLGVPESLLAEHGAVSEAVAKAMAVGIQQVASSDWGLATTGIAGPGGGTPEKPVGLVWIGLASPDGGVTAHRVQVNPKQGREHTKHWFAQYALHTLRKALKAPHESFDL
ncbi:MAG: competence/damage-inducible protein A [Vampirovibrionales bacterium]|nr:competence/damage-inducible protein A [Vampirovibrionales bacterium]